MGGEVGANIQKIYSYGHRNGFGMAFDPAIGSLWETENADDAFSELNRVVPGMNGGWIQLAGPLEPVRRLQVHRDHPLRQRPAAGPLSADPGRLHAALALSRMFMLPGAVYVDPDFSWKYEIGPAGTTFVSGNALGRGVQRHALDRFGARFQQVGGNGGSLYRFQLTADRLHVDVSADPRLADHVADNLFRRQKFDGTESETLQSARASAPRPTSSKGRTAISTSSRSPTTRSTGSAASPDPTREPRRFPREHIPIDGSVARPPRPSSCSRPWRRPAAADPGRLADYQRRVRNRAQRAGPARTRPAATGHSPADRHHSARPPLTTVPAPPNGTSAAMADAKGRASHVLYQDFGLSCRLTRSTPPSASPCSSATGATVSPPRQPPLDFSTTALNQQARVDIITTSADVFSVAAADFCKTPTRPGCGDPLVSGYIDIHGQRQRVAQLRGEARRSDCGSPRPTISTCSSSASIASASTHRQPYRSPRR